MKIKFTCDYIGRETAMKQYHKGDVAEFDHQAAIEIIRFGGGEEVIDEQKPERVYVSKPKKVKHADV